MRGLILPFAVFLVACGSNPDKNKQADTAVVENKNTPNTGYEADMMNWRHAKDNAFADPQQSPFDLATESFHGLNYFDVSESWVVLCHFYPAKTKENGHITDSKGGLRNYVTAGTLAFKKDNKDLKLTAFFEDSSQQVLFIMFRDSTNGNETYEGGRYMEAELPHGSDVVKLDFNRAYNPFCHYNHNYSCPIVPKENFLNIAVAAGEKKYR